MKYDVVYFVKETQNNEELVYSLRSVEKNFPYGKIWFYGGCPSNLTPDYHVHERQISATKYSNVANMLHSACSNPDISDNFWLFNDDFFVMQKLTKEDVDLLSKGIHNDCLYKQIIRSEDSTKCVNGYSRKLRRTANKLEELKKTHRNYEMHIPILINKKKMLKILDEHNTQYCSRSMYGNLYLKENIDLPDVKIFSITFAPHYEPMLLSTSDDSFRIGRVGKYIRDRFKNKSKWEK